MATSIVNNNDAKVDYSGISTCQFNSQFDSQAYAK